MITGSSARLTDASARLTGSSARPRPRVSPVDNVYAGLRVIAAHQRLHLAQAERAVRSRSK